MSLSCINGLLFSRLHCHLDLLAFAIEANLRGGIKLGAMQL